MKKDGEDYKMLKKKREGIRSLVQEMEKLQETKESTAIEKKPRKIDTHV